MTSCLTLKFAALFHKSAYIVALIKLFAVKFNVLSILVVWFIFHIFRAKIARKTILKQLG